MPSLDEGTVFRQCAGPALKAVYGRLTLSQGEALLQILADDSVPARAIVRTLKAHGHSIGKTTINEYRKRRRDTLGSH